MCTKGYARVNASVFLSHRCNGKYLAFGRAVATLPMFRPVCCNRPASPLNRPCRSCVANGVKGCPLVGVLDQSEVHALGVL